MSMKKILLVAMVTGFSGLFTHAQVTLQSSVPAVGMMQKAQLWNLQLSNNSRSSYDCRLELVLRDRSTGQEVMTAASGLFTLQPGVKQVRENTVAPVQYNYLTQGTNNRLNGLLPAGAYTVCFSLAAVGVKETSLAEECVSFDVEPLSPPMLIFPSDSAVLDNAPSQLSWMPPAPAGMFDKLHYELIITEVKDGQTAAEAIRENVPIFSDGYVMNSNISYPAAAPKLEKEKWYAWQVIAKDNGNYAAKTEAWVFRVSSTKQNTKTGTDIYLLMQDNTISSYEISTSAVHIKYFSGQPSFKGKVTFKDPGGRIIKSVTQLIKPGDNYMEFSIRSGFQKGILYSIALSDEKGKERLLTFTIK